MSTEIIRTTRRFSWSAVDPRLVRKLLVAVYEHDGRDDDVVRLRSLPDARLAAQAEASLGRPLAGRHMDAVVDVLRDTWLPTLPVGELDELIWNVQISLSGPARSAAPSTKPARVEFLRERRRTDTFKALLRAAFIRVHKVELEVLSRKGGAAGERQQQVVDLSGLARPDRRTPYPHQVETWSALDALYASREQRRSGLVVLPTGAGKTYTLVRWLLDQMATDPQLRVLWIADQQELLDQAARTFYTEAETRTADFNRRLRVIHGGASPTSTIADPQLDVACVTRQSLLGRSLDEPAKDRLARFLERPCVVVVDEAHHAVSRTYRKLLGHIQMTAPRSTMLVGLTATPWPTGAGMTKLLHDRFAERLAEVHVRDLVATGVLARPVIHSIDTDHHVVIKEDEIRAMVGGDVPASVLRRLDRTHRNEIIVDAWLDRREEWGKTLVFACDIEHADNLTARFASAGVDATVVHSQAEVERSSVLQRFRDAKDPCVLVSVGMLLEGVDVPDARTAFLTRPTTSRILMRQMIGRVLRGVAGGGEEIAHVVDLRDKWDDRADVLAPVDIPLTGVTVIEVGGEDDDPVKHVLPPVRDEISGLPIGEDVLRRIQRAYDELLGTVTPHVTAIQATTLVGFYELGHVNVPVFDHCLDTWQELIADELKGGRAGRSAIELFDSLPVPRPVKSDVDAVVEFVRSQEVEPPLVAARSTFSVRAIAAELFDLDLGERSKMEWLRARYEGTLARSAYYSFQAFWEAVNQEFFAILGGGPSARPEGFEPRQGRELPPLGSRADRDIQPIFKATVAHARGMLDEAGEWGYRELLKPEFLPKISWTRRPVRSTFAYWAPRISGQSKGHPLIRVNRLLQAPRSRVSDEVLQLLVWHELCHHLLPGRGHDAEFHRLLLMWPDASVLDAELDMLRERYDFDLGGPPALPPGSGTLVETSFAVDLPASLAGPPEVAL